MSSPASDSASRRNAGSAAKRLEFEEAAQLRDRIKELRTQQIYKA